MTGFYGQPPLGLSPSLMGADGGMRMQDTYGQGLPMMLPAEGLSQALQTTSSTPQPMNPFDPSASIAFKPQYPDTGGVSMYARGGRVQKEQSQTEQSQTEKPLWGLADALREQGRHGDTILAHISPEEAEILETMGGSGSINPETGLPEYFLGKIFKGIGNVFKKVVGPVGGAILGNMILPGVGGVIGGGMGGMFGHPNTRMGPLAGASVGQLGLSGLNALGAGASSLGYSGLGGGLKSLGGANYS